MCHSHLSPPASVSFSWLINIHRDRHTDNNHCPLCVLSLALSVQDHIYKLMKSDSYTRFLRSNVYQDLLMARKKVGLTISLDKIQFVCTV